MYQVDEKGYYGKLGGAYIPEILHRCVTELQETYSTVLECETFQQEFLRLLHDYAGRPSALYLACRLGEKYGCRIYLKREDLNHTGSHKINNVLGQILLAQQMGKSASLPKPAPDSTALPPDRLDICCEILLSVMPDDRASC